MWERRICYLAVACGSLVFYFVYQQWLAWILLLIVLLLPLLSLCLSLPAMLSVQAQLYCPGLTRVGVPTRTGLRITSSFPTPPTACRIRLVNGLTGERYTGHPGELVPTEHCGKMTITATQLVVYDYLGLFRRKLPALPVCTVLIMPKPIPGQLPQYGNRNNSRWKPKVGGGLAENHELRLFRPGDDLRNVHWKMSAKTGKLIYREAYEQEKQGHVFTLHLSGSPDQLDRKLGQLLFMSRTLLGQRLPHRVKCATGKGILEFSVKNEDTLAEGMGKLLSASPATVGDAPVADEAFWHHRIGGDDHEA